MIMCQFMTIYLLPSAAMLLIGIIRPCLIFVIQDTTDAENLDKTRLN